MNNTIIIIGGMGPQASAEALQRVVKQATAKCNKLARPFPQIIVLSLPVPDFISDTGNIESAFKIIESEARKAAAFEPSATMIACNTAHLLFNRLSHALPDLHLQSLIDSVVHEAKSRDMHTVALLASPTTIKTKLYQNALERAGIVCRVPDEKQINQLEVMINDTINRTSTEHTSRLRGMSDMFLNNECDGVLLGCTELPIIFGEHEDPRILDSLDIFSNSLVDQCFQDQI